MTTDIHIRPCTPDDASPLALVGQATFLEAYAGMLDGNAILAHCAHAHAPELYQAWLSTSGYALWLVEAQPGNAPIGYMVVAPANLPLPDLSPSDLEIKRIYLLSKFQRLGVGTELVDIAKAHARSCSASRLLLGVYAHNDAALAFYERVGFQTVGTRQFKVGHREYDDYIMGTALTP
jgi:ribosomal protein S18 acetylase RimI-like enzyme